VQGDSYAVVCMHRQLQCKTQTPISTMRQLKITQKLTNRDCKSLEKYLNDVSPIGLIDSQREVELAIAIKRGDKRAEEELVRANLRFVVSVAKQYQGQGLRLEDLINEGNLGLIKAAGRFDHTKGFKFISYAVWWIRQHILQGLAQQARTIRVPQNKIATINKMRAATSDLMQLHERKPTIDELADYIGVTQQEIEVCMALQNRPPSLDAPIGNDVDTSVMSEVLPDKDSPPPDWEMDLMSLRQDIADVLDTVTPREAMVLKLMFGIDVQYAHSLDEISEMLEVSRERVRQIKDRALQRLRRELVNSKLKSHLG